MEVDFEINSYLFTIITTFYLSVEWEKEKAEEHEARRLRKEKNGGDKNGQNEVDSFINSLSTSILFFSPIEYG